MVKYEETEDCIFRIEEDGKTWSIPKDLANSDYQKYLESLEDEA